MPDGDGLGRAQRLQQILYLLTIHPRGLTTAGLAERTGRSLRTIQRDLLDLQTSPPRAPVMKDGRRWLLLPSRHPDITRIDLTLPEAVALYLAARLLDRGSDEPNRHVATLLEKLAVSLYEPLAGQIAEDACLILARSKPPAPATAAFADVFATLAEAWAARRQVQIEYASPRKPEPRYLHLDPYLLEPLAPGLAVYCYGFAHEYREARWFKLERIRGVRVLDQTFEPPHLDRHAILRTGWGIMGGEAVTTVHLRFSPRVAARVKESYWHETMRLAERADGGCDLFLQIAHTIEIVPWLRGWGPDCEVIEPAALREQIAADAWQTAHLYGQSELATAGKEKL